LFNADWTSHGTEQHHSAQQFTLIAGKRAAMDGKNLNYSMRILKIIKENLDLA
jgi:hypothetical protein